MAGEEFGHYVRLGMKARRSWLELDQAEVGRRMGVSGQTISAMELGRRKITADDLPKLCAALECNLAELARGAASSQVRSLGLLPATGG